MLAWTEAGVFCRMDFALAGVVNEDWLDADVALLLASFAGGWEAERGVASDEALAPSAALEASIGRWLAPVAATIRVRTAAPSQCVPSKAKTVAMPRRA